ncbi:MAG: hypothetical protein ACM3SY_22465 [Candidatus Omnitrophota bacterium]
MKMKVFILSFLLLLVGYLAYVIIDANMAKPTVHESKIVPKENPLHLDTGAETATQEDDNFIYDEQDYFSRKLFQKKLPDLKKNEKIDWAFRMANTNPFL